MWEFPWWKSRLFVHALSRWDASFSTSKVKRLIFLSEEMPCLESPALFRLMKSQKVLIIFSSLTSGLFLFCTFVKEVKTQTSPLQGGNMERHAHRSYYSLFVSITYLCGKARQQWRLSRLCTESIHLVSVHLWSVRVTGSKRRGANINEIMFFFLHLINVVMLTFRAFLH